MIGQGDNLNGYNNNGDIFKRKPGLGINVDTLFVCLFVYTRVNGLQGTGGLLILYFILLNSTRRSPCDW